MYKTHASVSGMAKNKVEKLGQVSLGTARLDQVRLVKDMADIERKQKNNLDHMQRG